jgi:hypothetical protein
MRGARLPFSIWLWLGIAAAACSRDGKECHERMTSAQAIVAKVDGKSVASLQASLSAVNEAHAACEKAQLGPERESLLKAKNELTAQLDLIQARASRKKVQPPSAGDLARLVEQGDPSCPKGQAYKPKESKREVRCTGPQIVDMSVEALKAYYGDRKFKVKTQDAPVELRAELGSELYVFAFDALTAEAPRCVTAFAAPGVSWQEVTARLTGTAPEKLKLGTPAKSGRRELPFKVEHETDKPTIRLGQCP